MHIQGLVSSISNPRKRSFAQHAAVTTPSKIPRVGNSSSLSSFSRRTIISPDPSALISPPFEMPHSSHQPSSRSGRGFALRSSQSGHRLTSKTRPGKSTTRRLLDAPLHDQAYIARQYRSSHLPLKPMHETAPKSSLGNFSMLATEKLPSYKAVEGLVTHDGQTIQVWR